MLQKVWPVLIVDDEPDVLAVTRLVLKDVQVDGVPLQLHTAASKTEAIELLTGSSGPPVAPFFAVALVDVVMETPNAGLEVCDFLRTHLKNKTTQIYIRTGQAGLAPERAVVDRYDINGYFTKVETTEDKLYSMVKTGVRQNEFLTNTEVFFRILGNSAGKSRDGIAGVLGGFGAFLQSNQVSIGMITGGDVLTAIGIEAMDVVAECRRLDGLPGVPLSTNGDKLVFEGDTALFKSVGVASGDNAYLLYRGVSMPSPGLQQLHISFMKVLAALAKTSARDTAGVA
jgi:CheY-like chemotaxis protein